LRCDLSLHDVWLKREEEEKTAWDKRRMGRRCGGSSNKEEESNISVNNMYEQKRFDELI